MAAPPRTRARRPTLTWPPSAEPVGIDLSLAALLLIFGGMTFLGYLYVWAAPTDHGPTPWVRWMFFGDIFELLAWLGILGALGWRKPAGLVKGAFSWSGLLPLVALSIASLAAADLAEEAWVGPGPQILVGVGVFAAALREEIVFRGLLYHGLTRRLGGIAAMATSSLLFAIYHIPRMVHEEVFGEAMILRLISHFAFGMYLCRVRARTGSIWFPTAIHTLWNLAAFEIWIWAIPDGSWPSSFAWIRIAIDGVGLFIAYGLLLRAMYVFSARLHVSGPPDEKGRLGRGTKAVDVRSLYGAYAKPPSPAVFERFTDRARRAVVLAQEEARSEGATTVGTEHLLLGLIHESEGAASAALREWGIEPGDPLRLEELMADREQEAPTLKVDLHVKRALQLAALEADAWKDPHIGTEHLLVGLTALRRGEFASILRRQRVRSLWLRRTTLRLMSERERRPWPVTRQAPSERPANA